MTRAESEPHRELRRALDGMREQHRRGVEQRHEQHQRHRHHHDVHLPGDRADDELLQWRELRLHVTRFAIAAAHNGCELLLRQRRGHAGFQSPDHVEKFVGPPVHEVPARLRGELEPHVDVGIEIRHRRHHTDDDRRDVLDVDDTADDARIAAKLVFQNL